MLRIYSICFNVYRRLYLFPLAGLDEKEFGLMSQTGTFLGCEVRHDLLNGNEELIRRVDSSVFPMAQNTEHEAVSVSMPRMALVFLQNLVQTSFGHVVIHTYAEPKPLKHMLQVLCKKKEERKGK